MHFSVLFFKAISVISSKPFHEIAVLNVLSISNVTQASDIQRTRAVYMGLSLQTTKDNLITKIDVDFGFIKKIIPGKSIYLSSCYCCCGS